MNFRKTAAVLLAALMSAVMIAGCGKVNASEAALTVNGETVSAGTASTFLRYQQVETYSLMKLYGLLSDESGYWDMEMPAADTGSSSSSSSSSSASAEKKTYGDAFKQDARDSIVTMTLIRQNADKYGFSLTDDQNKAITDAAAEFINKNGSVAKWIGADQASVENMLSLLAYQTLMYNKIIADTDREVSDEEAAQSTIVYARLSLDPSDDYEGTKEEYAEKIKADAEKLLSRMNEGSSSETAESADTEETAENTEEETSDKDVISEMAKEINDTFYVTSASFGDDDTSLDDAVKEAARKLSDGQICDSVIETDSFIYVIKMISVFDKEATETKKSSIISERESAKYKETIDGWKEAATIVEGKGWTNLKVTDKEKFVPAE